MKSLTPRQSHLLNILADGTCHSGQQLGETLGISRTAIWKNIDHLEAVGIAIERIPQQGYRLKTPFIPLNEHAIRQVLPQVLNQALTLHLFASLNSTNRFLKTQPPTPSLTCCIAETQTHGRGRFGRYWHSPFGENIYCSLTYHSEADPTELSGLSLVISLAVLQALKAYTTSPIKIKWPNDLLWNDKKLAGILIEMTAESHGGTDLIIGVGLNVNTPTENNSNVDKPWCSLYEIVGHTLDRNKLIADLITQLHQHLEHFSRKGFAAFHDAWNQHDYLRHRTVCVTNPSGTLKGQVLGVNEMGFLLLEDAYGTTHMLSSGDTSWLKPMLKPG